MTTTNYVARRAGARATRLAALCLLALAAVLFKAQEARAQWAQPDAAGNINNTNTGNVGIGTASPNQKLGVQGMFGLYPVGWVAPTTRGMFMFHTGSGGSIYAFNYPGGTGDPIGLSAQSFTFSTYTGATGIERMTLANNGNFGIGTSSPDQRLGVQGMLGLYPQPWVAPTTRGMFMLHTGTGGSIYAFNYPGGAGDPLGLSASTITFSTYTGATGIQRMTLANNGNFGIGTDAPVSKLHVVGDITVTGNVNAKYQDVAEWVPSTQKLAVGTVVVLDTRRDNHVLASTDAYDTGVAGVVSARPGLALGEAGEGKVLVATTGRVRVRVDATRAPIMVGDLLVTSDRQGYAMKSEPVRFGGRKLHAPGTIIGKALESTAGGTGEILVLLSLQ